MDTLSTGDHQDTTIMKGISPEKIKVLSFSGEKGVKELLVPDITVKNKLVVIGSCNIENGNYAGQKINLAKDNTVITVLSESKEFKFFLDFDSQYIITFSKPQFITKQFLINTMNIPATRMKYPFDPVKFSTTLQPQPDSQIVTFTQPVGLIGYNKSVEDFDYKTNYRKTAEEK